MEETTQIKNVYLFQPQYAVEFRKESTYWLPYSVGCLWSYVDQFSDISENFDLKDIIFKREPPEQLLERMENPSVCGFSCYIWNEKYCLTIAEMIKQRWPECVIVFGGAQTNSSMLLHGFIDCIIMSEGEENFLDLLRNIKDNQPVKQFYEKRRMQQLDIPSPYLTGVFDKILKDNPTALWSMTFETNRGCPYSCTFCDWGGLTYSKVKRFELDKIREELEWSIGKPVTYLICADANFGIFKDRDLEIAKIIREVADKGNIDSVNLQYAKNSTEIVFQIAKTLGPLSRGITVSVQSMHDDTLSAIKRKNMDINNVQNLMELSEEYGVTTYTEVILGLPLETLETWKQGFSEILEMGQHHSIDMWFAQLLYNSEMAQPESRKQYGIESIISKDYMPLYNEGDYRDIEEEIELVQSTSTMTVDDMIEGYMYGWMIIHFHISGYSQIIAKYLRSQDISWREYYDAMFDALPKHELFGPHFESLKKIVATYLNTGELVSEEYAKGGHGIHALSYSFMYDNKSHACAFAEQIANTLYHAPQSVVTVQEHFLFDKNVEYPVIVQHENKTITISPKLSANTEFEFYLYRRQGLLKNIVKDHQE